MEINESVINAFNMYQAQYSQVDKIWNYFGIVSLAVAGFTIGSEQATKTIKEPIFILLGYIVFCIGNYRALTTGHEFLYQLACHYNQLAKPFKLDKLDIAATADIKQFYIGVVCTFCVAIVAVAYGRLTLSQANHTAAK
ncbi:hypothetical protein [Paraferrimonas sp. SM1919]|uniref:hypothetical protein n=1 Tax=Paraferrimonas sp. SM1919 TaxID=2662263 RepID=UPI0013D6ADC6|nr:hypothetical protein [Paraferrimonas sp. SM1919]